MNITPLSKLVFFMVDSTDHRSGKTGISPYVQLSKNGGAFFTSTGNVRELGHGWYWQTQVVGEMDLGFLAVRVTAAGCDDTNDLHFIMPDQGEVESITVSGTLPVAARGVYYKAGLNIFGSNVYAKSGSTTGDTYVVTQLSFTGVDFGSWFIMSIAQVGTATEFWWNLGTPTPGNPTGSYTPAGTATGNATIVLNPPVGTSGLAGPNSVTLTFRDALGAVVPNVAFNVQGQGYGATDTSGAATIGLNNGSYMMTAQAPGRMLFPTTPLVVVGNSAINIIGTSVLAPVISHAPVIPTARRY